MKKVKAWVSKDSLQFFRFNKPCKFQTSIWNKQNKILSFPRLYKNCPKKVDGRSYREYVEISITTEIMEEGKK